MRTSGCVGCKTYRERKSDRRHELRQLIPYSASPRTIHFGYYSRRLKKQDNYDVLLGRLCLFRIIGIDKEDNIIGVVMAVIWPE